MEPGTSIVCGVDHSSGARAAARFAGDLADRLALRLVLVYAVPPPISQRELGMAALTTDPAVLEALRDDGVELLEEVAEKLGPDRDVIAEVRIGGASDLLREVAESSRAEFLVVGSRGLGSVGTLLLGSVSLRLAVHGPCPTVIVPESSRALGEAPVMCAVDDSDEARTALAVAASLAERLGATLLLAHAASDDAPASDGHELLACLVAERSLGTAVERIVIRGESAAAVVETATARDVGIVVVGSRGRGALTSAALGSVSSAVARRAPCAVAIVRT